MSHFKKGYEKDHHKQQEGRHDDAKEKEHCIARHLDKEIYEMEARKGRRR
jgi:hypothetical protein